MSNNWEDLREQFFEDYPGLYRKWQVRYAEFVEQGMAEWDAAAASDNIVGIGPEDSRVQRWLGKKGVVLDDEEVPPGTTEESKSTTDVKNVRWVADNLSNMQAKPSSAPSPTAWNMLVFARTNPTQTAKFWSDLYKPIMLPAKKDLENTSRDLEDEERLLGIIDQVRKMAEKELA